MHVFLTNDDGPPNDTTSPYILNFATTIKEVTDWDLSIGVPVQQRSWIGKAHIIGEDVHASYLYTSKDGQVDGPKTVPDPSNKGLEWTLLTGTPASCANIGCTYLYEEKGPVDLVISGPNYGRNTSAAYIMSSGTVGAALEANLSGRRSIALSFSYTQDKHPEEHIAMASRLSVQLIKWLLDNWQTDVWTYSINVPLFSGLSMQTPIRWAPILENEWSSIFKQTKPGLFKWSPDYRLCDETVYAAGPGSDAWTIMHNEVSVSPIRAVFHNVAPPEEEIKLHNSYVDPTDPYVYRAWADGLAAFGIGTSASLDDKPIFVYQDYDSIDFENRVHDGSRLEYAFAYRKALTRKNHLALTIAHFCAKRPTSILTRAFPESHDLDLDYAEFLDDALDDAYELRQEIEKREKLWILKPSLSERADGIRIFRTLEQLQDVCEELESIRVSEEDGLLTALRHFTVQEYISNPMLLLGGRKFHLRVYVLCAGVLKVWVWREILALFAGVPYSNDSSSLEGHLTNTCFQGERATVKLLAQLSLDRVAIVAEIEQIVHDLFLAAQGEAIYFQPRPDEFEFFGVDFLVDSDSHVHLLEVNAYPDFKQTGADLQFVVGDLFKATVSEIIAPLYGIDSRHDERLHQVLGEKCS